MSDTSDSEFSNESNTHYGRGRKMTRGHGNEAKRVIARLNGFDFEKSAAWHTIRENFSSGITHNELKSIALLICEKIQGLKLDRDASRDNRVLIKWFEENWTSIKPIISKIKIHDQAENIISNLGAD